MQFEKRFALGQTEVTQGQWKAIMGFNPSDKDHSDCGDACPVDSFKTSDMYVFIERLSAKSGKTYRLPSEAEWEYACRAGGTSKYCGGDDLDNVAWHKGNSNGRPQPVARKRPNAFGLYDMSGNLWEYVEDTLIEHYKGAPTDGSAWKPAISGRNSARGGSWANPASGNRAAARSYEEFAYRGDFLGFRVARDLP